MGYETAVQTAIFQRLKNDATLQGLVTDVYDSVPDAATLPIVTIGEDVITENDTADTLGALASITIHTWTDSGAGTRGRKQVKNIQGAVYDALHRAELDAAGHHFIASDFSNSQTFMDADGRTWHGIQIFNLIIDKG